MEALIVLVALAGLGLAARAWGVDTARTDEREPRRSL